MPQDTVSRIPDLKPQRTEAAVAREQERAERRAQALRDNLRRRKHQSEARAEADGDKPEGGDGNGRSER